VGREVTDEIYPQEARLDDAFSLTKGCYIGQEVVAKIDTYGGLNKQLFRLKVSHDDPVASGTRLTRELEGEVRDLGVVTSWAYSFAADGGVVLGYVKRKHQDAGTVFQLGDSGATAVLEG
jgi:folate-binding protein YgfZ